MTEPALITREEALKLLEKVQVPEKLSTVLQAGWGQVTIVVQDHKPVYVKHEIGVQVRLIE